MAEDTIGRKFDAGKARLGLLPPHAIQAFGRVLTFGSKKYADHNWLHVKGAEKRYLDAALRHMFAYMSGEKRDPETNESHLAHVMCCVSFLLDAEESGWKFPEEDNKESKQ